MRSNDKNVVARGVLCRLLLSCQSHVIQVETRFSQHFPIKLAMGKRSRVIEKIASATKKTKKDIEEEQHESSSSEDEATLPPGTRLSDEAPKKKVRC